MWSVWVQIFGIPSVRSIESEFEFEVSNRFKRYFSSYDVRTNFVKSQGVNKIAHTGKILFAQYTNCQREGWYKWANSEKIVVDILFFRRAHKRVILKSRLDLWNERGRNKIRNVLTSFLLLQFGSNFVLWIILAYWVPLSHFKIRPWEHPLHFSRF